MAKKSLSEVLGTEDSEEKVLEVVLKLHKILESENVENKEALSVACEFLLDVCESVELSPEAFFEVIASLGNFYALLSKAES